MIDTEKYEGHTPAPWAFTVFDPLHLWGESPIISGGEGYSQNKADWKLIADAPLLLAEVKRLSALADALWKLIPSYLSTEATDVWNEHMGDGEE